jgi:hypothetical protein
VIIAKNQTNNSYYNDYEINFIKESNLEMGDIKEETNIETVPYLVITDVSEGKEKAISQLLKSGISIIYFLNELTSNDLNLFEGLFDQIKWVQERTHPAPLEQRGFRRLRRHASGSHLALARQGIIPCLKISPMTSSVVSRSLNNMARKRRSSGF